jgi:hypothetical protein
MFVFYIYKKDTRHVTHMYSKYVFDTIIQNKIFHIQIFPKGRSKSPIFVSWKQIFCKIDSPCDDAHSKRRYKIPKWHLEWYWIKFDSKKITGLRRVWRYQRGNQKPYVEEEQKTQWPKENVQRDKQRSTKHTYRTKNRVTRTPQKTGVNSDAPEG